MNLTFAIIIPAGGSNKRYRSPESKLTQLINDISVIEHCLTPFTP